MGIVWAGWPLDPYAGGSPFGAICSRGDLDSTHPAADGCYDTKKSHDFADPGTQSGRPTPGSLAGGRAPVQTPRWAAGIWGPAAHRHVVVIRSYGLMMLCMIARYAGVFVSDGDEDAGGGGERPDHRRAAALHLEQARVPEHHPPGAARRVELPLRDRGPGLGGVGGVPLHRGAGAAVSAVLSTKIISTEGHRRSVFALIRCMLSAHKHS
eukprot:515553-Prorocentrum_minimum.AAC.1